MRAVPDCSSGTLCLPMGRVMAIRSGAAGDVAAAFACSGASSEKRGVDLPFCSTATVNDLNCAFGASAVTYEGAGLPDGLVGLLDANDRDRLAPGDDIDCTGGNQEQDDQPGERSHHAYD